MPQKDKVMTANKRTVPCEPTEEMVERAAHRIALSPLIEPKLAPSAWMGLARAVVEAALSAAPAQSVESVATVCVKWDAPDSHLITMSYHLDAPLPIGTKLYDSPLEPASVSEERIREIAENARATYTGTWESIIERAIRDALAQPAQQSLEHPDRHADCQDECQTGMARGPTHGCDWVARRCDVLACEEMDAQQAQTQPAAKRNISYFKRDEVACHVGVSRFSSAMLDKLDAKRKSGRCGWNDPKECSIEQLCTMLADHWRKQDLVDIANFCMMIWNRKQEQQAQTSAAGQSEGTSQQTGVAPSVGPQAKDEPAVPAAHEYDGLVKELNGVSATDLVDSPTWILRRVKQAAAAITALQQEVASYYARIVVLEKYTDKLQADIDKERADNESSEHRLIVARDGLKERADDLARQLSKAQSDVAAAFKASDQDAKETAHWKAKAEELTGQLAYATSKMHDEIAADRAMTEAMARGDERELIRIVNESIDVLDKVPVDVRNAESVRRQIRENRAVLSALGANLAASGREGSV